jgi:tetratricopeptide (TPR) repeat protein
MASIAHALGRTAEFPAAIAGIVVDSPSAAAETLPTVVLSKNSGSSPEAFIKARCAEMAVAVNNQGVKLKEGGNIDEAIDCYRQATACAPDCAALWFNLGSNLLTKNNLEEAVNALRRAVGLDPKNIRFLHSLAAALNARGVALKAAKHVADAITCYREALALAPEHSAIWSNLGNALVTLGQQAINHATIAAPRDVGSKVAIREMRQLEEAVQCHRRALALEPDGSQLRINLAIALNTLGVVCRSRGFTRKAVACHRESVALHPKHAWGWANLGNALKDLKYIESAVECHRRAIALDPELSALTCNLGITLALANRSEEAIACFNEVLTRQPDDANTRFDRGLSLLRIGRLAEGWEDYEARFEAGKLPLRDVPGERWQGAPYPGQRLLLLSEQGFGDAIWTARYLKQVKTLGGELILEAREELIPLLEAQGFADQIVAKGAPLPSADWHAHICSLPRLFSKTFADVSGTPYLTVPKGQGQEAVAAIKAVKNRLRVGIVWSGSATFPANHERRASLGAFVSAFRLPGVQLFSLQKGPAEAELKHFPEAGVIDLAPMVRNFADTASAVSALDLIIMTDSGVAHLSGAMGTPVWLLANAVPYWLWGKTGLHNPWYDSLTLFRTSEWNNWSAVFDSASAALCRKIFYPTGVISNCLHKSSSYAYESNNNGNMLFPFSVL